MKIDISYVDILFSFQMIHINTLGNHLLLYTLYSQKMIVSYVVVVVYMVLYI